jgi:hypothetical protein
MCQRFGETSAFILGAEQELVFARLHGVTFKKAAVFIVTAVRTTKLTEK